MDKELEKKFAALADDMLKDFREMPLENMEEVLDFNEDEESIFNMIYNAKSFLENGGLRFRSRSREITCYNRRIRKAPQKHIAFVVSSLISR